MAGKLSGILTSLSLISDFKAFIGDSFCLKKSLDFFKTFLLILDSLRSHFHIKSGFIPKNLDVIVPVLAALLIC